MAIKNCWVGKNGSWHKSDSYRVERLAKIIDAIPSDHNSKSLVDYFKKINANRQEDEIIEYSSNGELSIKRTKQKDGGYISRLYDKNGQALWENEYENMSFLPNGNIKVISNDQFAVLDPEGRIIIDFGTYTFDYDLSFHCISGQKIGYARKDRKFYLIDENVNKIIDTAFDHIKFNDDETIRAFKDQYTYILDAKGNTLLSFKGSLYPIRQIKNGRIFSYYVTDQAILNTFEETLKSFEPADEKWNIDQYIFLEYDYIYQYKGMNIHATPHSNVEKVDQWLEANKQYVTTISLGKLE